MIDLFKTQFFTGSKFVFYLSLSSLKQACFGLSENKKTQQKLGLNLWAEEEGFEPPVTIRIISMKYIL